MILRTLFLASLFAHPLAAGDLRMFAKDHLKNKRSNFIELEDERDEEFLRQNPIIWSCPHIYSLEKIEDHCRWQSQQRGMQLRYEKLLATIIKQRDELIGKSEQHPEKIQTSTNTNLRTTRKRKRTEWELSSTQEQLRPQSGVQMRADEAGSLISPDTRARKTSEKKRTLEREKMISRAKQISDLADWLTDEYKSYKVVHDGFCNDASGAKFIRDLVALLDSLEKKGEHCFTAIDIANEIYLNGSDYATSREMRQSYVVPVFDFLRASGYLVRKRDDKRPWNYLVTKKLRKLLNK